MLSVPLRPVAGAQVSVRLRVALSSVGGPRTEMCDHKGVIRHTLWGIFAHHHPVFVQPIFCVIGQHFEGLFYTPLLRCTMRG